LPVATGRDNIQDAVEVIATVGIEQPRTVVVDNHGYPALIDEPIEEPVPTGPRRRGD
jgi:hypothetical protein